MYDEAGEKKRLEEYNQFLLENNPNEDSITTTNREWPYLIKSYIRHGHKQTYLNLNKLLKYGVDVQEKYYCYADLLPPHPVHHTLAV